MIDLLTLAFVDVLIDLLQPGTIARIVLDALSKSALYVMIASGLSLIFGLMGVLNFAHGSLTMIGAYLGGAVMVVTVSAGMNGPARFVLFFLAIAATFGALTLLGSAVEVTLIRPIYDREPLFQILLTFGLVLVLDELARIVVELNGLQPRSKWQAAIGTAPDFLSNWYTVAGVSTRGLYLFEVLLGALVVAGIWAFLTRTRYGLYIRAGSEDPEMTRALGVDVRKAFTVVFGVGAGLAGVAGAVLMWDPRFGATVPLSVETLLVAFVVVIIGGLGSFRGTVVAAGIVGLTDALMTWLFQNHVAFPGLPEMVTFLVLVGVLIVRPQGLFGVAEVGGH
ncbi:branched-chain amino acid ABC transporter permease [Natronoarchaeum rubrum]|uniref:branched-chain amino acid ABC transporter permease n=1 Tax=Natronoarchaeum rubrum TaxID=755311 RepID=UPI002110F6F5|nr:branched-chain amino acid ABC transporter permease [Natronoarchaeum rubrum]HMB49569.1 branched-chain amino acid ABC transporter permease [Natronoarchaeum rubrum]